MGGELGTAAATASPGLNELRINLFGLGMTALHRVGLAGLWMTLRYFERTEITLEGGTWELDDRSVTLRWGDEGPGPLLKSLCEASFRVDPHGLIWFPALGEPEQYPAAAVTLHEAVLGTFLQHGRTREADPSTKPGGTLVPQDEEDSGIFRFQRVRSYAHQTAWTSLIDRNGRLQTASLAGWQFPGGVVRHTAFNQTALEEPPERWLALLYAPVGSAYFRVHDRREGIRSLFALVLPEIGNLRLYANARARLQQAKMPDLLVSGTADAGWRLLATFEANHLLRSLRSTSCRVISFGIVPWSSQQKTRVEVIEVKPESELDLRTYNLCRLVLPPQRVQPEGRDAFWYVPASAGLIASNLAHGRAWYRGFADLLGTASRMSVMRYERRGLAKMVDQAPFEYERERVFVRICHEAWRRRQGMLGVRAQRERAAFESLVSGERERLRSTLLRCKNAATFREAITAFWSRSGTLPSLQAHWEEILPLLSESQWKVARDLALLALASYSSPEPVKADSDNEEDQETLGLAREGV